MTRIKRDSYKYILVALLILLIIMGNYFIEKNNDKKEWQSKWSGKLQSRVKSTAKYPLLMFGDVPLRPLDSDKPVIKFIKYNDEIFLRLVNGEAQVSINIRDEKGNLIGLIRDNVWAVVQSSGADRNFNQDTLEILDAQGQVIFQVYIQGEKVYLALFYKPQWWYVGHWLHELQGRKGSLFKYPSSEYPGELNPVTK